MLPKIIHYCWFGGAEIPDDYKKIISEWALMHPDYTIKQWDETNAPLSVPYIKTAIEHKNWANVSNYVRLYALLHEGGIYLDTDMKVIQSLDSLLSYNCFLGFESGETDSTDFWVNNAIMAAIPNHPFVADCERYLLQQFDGTEQANLSSPHLVTNILKDKYNLKIYGRQLLGDIMLFEKEIFYPVPCDKVYLLKDGITFPKETIAVHMWGRTWFTTEMLMTEMDSLRRYAHELRDFNVKITHDLEEARNQINIIISEKNELITRLENTLKKIETSQLKLEQQVVATDRKLDELINCSIWSIIRRKLSTHK